MYAGIVCMNNTNHPCTLSFSNSTIVFKLISNGDLENMQMGKFGFDGYISTENGIMNYRAWGALQTAWSQKGSNMSTQEFRPDSIILSSPKNDIELRNFSQINICFNNLESIGDYVQVANNDWEKLNFNFQRSFQEIQFLDDLRETLTLENPVRYHFSNSGLQYFKLTIDPFFSYIPASLLSIEAFGVYAKSLGWFLQLIFGAKQHPTDILLFERTIKEKGPNTQQPYYFLNSELIRKKSTPAPYLRYPVFKINEITNALSTAYRLWCSFSDKASMLTRLYFNEINSAEYITDDRFKNLCAIIQGLEILGTTNKSVVAKGEMNLKLRQAMVTGLEAVLCNYISLAALHKLLEVVGHQRDYFQHLSKTLSYNLNDVTEEFVTVNTLLQIIIRFHFLKAIALPDDEIMQLIQSDLYWIKKELLKIQSNIISKFQLEESL